MMQMVQQPHEPQTPQQARSYLAHHVDFFSESISMVPRYLEVVTIVFIQELSFLFSGKVRIYGCLKLRQGMCSRAEFQA
jgi:hypothetical protein